MKIVLTNDDGVTAPGMEALLRACEGLGEVVVVAPAFPQSGVGHRLTTERAIPIVELDTARYGVEGTPADCARVALRHLVHDADWVIAGINRGGNLGADFYPSGTLAAAREAALLGCPSIALSQYVRAGQDVDWEATARRAARVLGHLLEERVETGTYWNVNLPYLEDDGRAGEIRFCPVDWSPMDVRFRLEEGRVVYEGSYHERPRLPRHDVDVCFSGHIAVSRLTVDINARDGTAGGLDPAAETAGPGDEGAV